MLAQGIINNFDSIVSYFEFSTYAKSKFNFLVLTKKIKENINSPAKIWVLLCPPTS